MVMIPADRQRLLDRIDQDLYELSHGPLVKFPLFHAVGALTPGVLEACPMSKAELARAERKLGAALVQMVENGDSASLLKAARTVGHFTSKPERLNKNLKNPETFLDFKTTLMFLRKHVDQYWTLAEIQQRLYDETRVWQHKKTLHDWCKKDYGFPIKPDKAGRPKKR